MSQHLRRLLAVLVVGALPLAAQAQQYPNKPIHLMNPNAAGGVSDTMARLIAHAMEPTLGQSIIIEPRPGAVGVPGVESVLKSSTDGYYIGDTCPGGVIVLPATGEPVPFDFVKDSQIVGLVGGLDVLFTSKGDSPYKNIDQFIAAAKANPGKLSIGMVQTPSNVVPVAFFAKCAGININIIGYKGETLALADLLAGTITMAVNAPGTVQSQVRAGAVNAVLMLNKKRNPIMPNVPSLSDTKVEVFEPSNYCVMFGPKGIQPQALAKLNSSLNEAGKDPALQKTWAEQGLVPYIGDTPANATAFFADIGKRWQDVVKEVDYSKYR